MKRGRATWATFGACTALGTGVLAWLTSSMLDLERSECDARARLDHELQVGDVLWRIDASLAPLLAQEAQRPAVEYAAFNRVAEPFTNLLGKLEPGAIVAPSPLLSFRSDLFPLHFQIDAAGAVTSPQVPQGNELDVTQSQLPALQLEAPRALLQRITRRVSAKELIARCSAIIEEPAQVTQQVQQQGQALQVEDGPRQAMEDNYSQRAQSTKSARQQSAWVANDSTEPPPGQLVPLWLDDEAGDLLLFVRRAAVGGAFVLQGIVGDWPKLRDALLAEVADATVARGASLVRADAGRDRQRRRMLTTVPAALVTQSPPTAPQAWSPVRTLLLGAWLTFAGAACAVGFTLRQALAFGERRARFASSVTHELRTPLTTFRMYSEILASDMVREPEKRREYLLTLQSEADRLARVVENVLSYARIEEGRFAAHRERVTLSGLVERLRPVLVRRATDAARAFTCEVQDGDAPLDTDVEAVGQILFNLLDNACKHGGGAIDLHARRDASGVTIAVRDHGAGVPARYQKQIFAAFDRGARPPGDNVVPGVGLGLALARGLARDLGGELTVEDAVPGARFTLRLPLARPGPAARLDQ